MNRKTFFKSLLGLAIAPMALAKVKKEKIQPVNSPEIPKEIYELIKQYQEDYIDMLIYGMPRRYIDKEYKKKIYFAKGIEDFIK